jgi:hypothetical protein
VAVRRGFVRGTERLPEDAQSRNRSGRLAARLCSLTVLAQKFSFDVNDFLSSADSQPPGARIHAILRRVALALFVTERESHTGHEALRSGKAAGQRHRAGHLVESSSLSPGAIGGGQVRGWICLLTGGNAITVLARSLRVAYDREGAPIAPPPGWKEPTYLGLTPEPRDATPDQ